MRLAHLHLPGITPFSHASNIQNTLVSRLLAQKRLQRPPRSASGLERTPESVPPPDPIILTFTPNPVYTTGRRHLPHHHHTPAANDGSSSTTHADTDADDGAIPAPLKPIQHLLTSSPPLAEFHPTLRGGQTTYHGPGQLVAYAILDMRLLRIGVADHVRLLEGSVIDVLRGYGVCGTRTSDPGVWVVGGGRREDSACSSSSSSSPPPRKIAAVGVHVRRFVSSHGIGLNVTEEPRWYFRQIVACGLEGREVTSLEGEGVQGDDDGGNDDDVLPVSVDDVAGRFVEAFAGRFNSRAFAGRMESGAPRIEDVYRVSEHDVLD